MHETTEDLERLQRLLDRSDADAGHHLSEVITPERRVSASALAEMLTGMRLLTLATVTRDGRPLAAAVDGIFFRGAFHFGSSPFSYRIRHILERPAVSACHLPSEELQISVHGTATPIDVNHPDHALFRQTLLDIYLPRYGPDWEDILTAGAVYVRIDAEKMFTFWMPES